MSDDSLQDQRSHLAFAWLCLLAFVLLGIGLELLHAFKVGAYLDVQHTTRRMMWRLSHAHGTLLALLNIGFVLCLSRLPKWPTRGRRLAGSCLRAATLLLPLGFFLGGLQVYDGDPGVGVWLAPLGGLLMVLGVGATAFAAASEARRTRVDDRPSPPAAHVD